MKKKIKKVITALGIICFTILFICLAGLPRSQKFSDSQVYAKPIEWKFENDLIALPTDYEEAFYENQSESVDTYNEILRAFENSNSGTHSLNQKQQSENNKYPDYYGGAYIDEETGGLVVLVKKEASDLKSVAAEIAAITKETTTISNKSIKNGIRIEACDVSCNEIETAIDFLSDKIEELQRQGVEITAIRDDIKNGKVIVSILNLTDEKEEKVRSISNQPFLQFEEGEYASEGIADSKNQEITDTKEGLLNAMGYTAKIYGGGQGTVGNKSWGFSTIGFAAKKGNRYGFVIAGHAPTALGEKFYYSADGHLMGDTIGTVTKSAYFDNSTADAAFLEAVSGITITNQVVEHTNVGGGWPFELPVGTRVSMQGVKSGRQSGKIVSYYETIKHTTGKTIRKQTAASYPSQGGDSGAPILYLYKGKYYICGIHSTHKDIAELSYFSPSKNIVDELGISFVTSTEYVSQYK